MKVFIDTNILIDFIARREQFYQTAANLINLGIKGELKLYATPLSYATCVFIAQKVFFHQYIWLINTLKVHRALTLDELDRKCGPKRACVAAG